MTIGIGVLASEEGNELKPNRVILIADTKGSFGDSYSMNRLHKVFFVFWQSRLPKVARKLARVRLPLRNAGRRFTQAGQAFLLHVDGNGTVSNFTLPGFAAIGSGLSNAMFWLGYRNHHLGFPVRRAAYHAFEAKIMAESSPFVNESMDILVADS